MVVRTDPASGSLQKTKSPHFLLLSWLFVTNDVTFRCRHDFADEGMIGILVGVSRNN